MVNRTALIGLDDRWCFQSDKLPGFVSLLTGVHRHIGTADQGTQATDLAGIHAWPHHPETGRPDQVALHARHHFSGHQDVCKVLGKTHRLHLADNHVTVLDQRLAFLDTFRSLELDHHLRTLFDNCLDHQPATDQQCNQR